ncbi:MAG: 23S rRNA (guanine2445-N2)-methyltransferase / 23S rRNA (guanine2069-N7)-methyltransferase [Halieaceae bacterium]|jgi:23S rRNA (guanine2445-N2)-methyltransferase / 23S rRNA (guanine2069-N7)-methyltransferase
MNPTPESQLWDDERSVPADHRFFAPCPKGLEGLLLLELQQLGLPDTRETVAGCYFGGAVTGALKVCLWSRLANRVLLPLATFPVASAEELYQGVLDLPWVDHWSGRGSIAIDFTGRSDEIRNTQFGAQKIKDAIVDYYRERSGDRPSVDKHNPDFRLNARLHRNGLTIAIDLSGSSLHRRGYRLDGGAAPLKENLAAALLLRADWPGIAARGGALMDPMCGSGTLLIEGAMMAADMAPGLHREKFGFESWSAFPVGAWRELREEAQERARLGVERVRNPILGQDFDRRVIGMAGDNIRRAGVSQLVTVKEGELRRLLLPTNIEAGTGLVLTNPPYGERLGEQRDLEPLYEALGERLKQGFGGWRVGIFTGNRELAGGVRLRSDKQYALYNGVLPCTLLMYDIGKNQTINADRSVEPIAKQWSEGATMFANRLRKNQKRLGKWARRAGVECYRVYDADMPEYAVAIDIYGDYAHVAEYQAPMDVDARGARRRMEDIKLVMPSVLEIPPANIHYKVRERQRGTKQYQSNRNTSKPVDDTSNHFEVNEGDARFWVNLQDYLDTGLFLDHRPLRRRVCAEAQGKSVLNLYCYTAAISVQAAIGGASSSVSVDLSKTYLRWAARNYRLNNIDEGLHRLEDADCSEWLQSCKQVFDLIILDPPSFSNSKRMEGTLDVQRDHVELIDLCMARLAPGGRLYFSTNLRKFKLDEAVSAQYQVEDIARSSLDEDFARRPSIHHLWGISR